MKEIIALSGVSGVGKTYLRTHDEKLSKLPFVDIADIYASQPMLSSYNAFTTLLIRVQDALTAVDTVVVEASLLVTSNQRHRLKMAADIIGAKLTYINIPTPSQKTLLDRIEADLDFSLMVAANEEAVQIARRYYAHRKEFILAATH